MKRKNLYSLGFTLIELLAVIVVLAIIALIATPIVLNTINSAKEGAAERSAVSYIKAVENAYVKNMIESDAIEDNTYSIDSSPLSVDISGTGPSDGSYTIQGGIVTNAVLCINGYRVEYMDGVSVSKGSCKDQGLKLAGSVKLSSYSVNLVYPKTTSFEIVENLSGGELSCKSSDEDIVTCVINGSTVFVSTKEKEGTATLTITSEETFDYKEAAAAYVVITQRSLLSVTANGYVGEYDGNAHGISVVSDGATITYGTSEDNISSYLNPQYTDVGEYVVYYKVEREDYKTVTGSRTVVITQAQGKVELEATAGNVAYNETKEVEITKNISEGNLTIEVSDTNIVEAIVENNKIKITGKAIGTATVTVISEETRNYKRATKEYTAEVIKANNELELSETSGKYTYPEAGTIEVTKNTSGGALSCETSNSSVATCSISGTIVTVTPGTTEGYATITIKSASTTNYNEAQASYEVITTKGTLTSYTVTGYNAPYDGRAHGITVMSSGATITYSTDGINYSSENPTYTEAGTYTVYYKIDVAGYNTITGSEVITIVKAPDMPICSLNESGWATSKYVSCEFEAGYVNEYSIDDGNTWNEYNGKVLFTSNGSFIARINDGVNYITTEKIIVDKIDTTSPTFDLSQITYVEGFDGWTGDAIITDNVLYINGNSLISDFYDVNGDYWYITYDFLPTVLSNSWCPNTYSAYNSGSVRMDSTYYDSSYQSVISQNGYGANGFAPCGTQNSWSSTSWDGWGGYGVKYVKFRFFSDSPTEADSYYIRNFKVWGQLVNSFYIININSLSDDNGIQSVKYLYGNQSADNVCTNGTTISNNQFTVTSNGTYTVCAKDYAGNTTIHTIDISRIG